MHIKQQQKIIANKLPITLKLTFLFEILCIPLKFHIFLQYSIHSYITNLYISFHHQYDVKHHLLNVMPLLRHQYYIYRNLIQIQRICLKYYNNNERINLEYIENHFTTNHLYFETQVTQYLNH